MHPIHSAISVYQGNIERILMHIIDSINLFDLLHEDNTEYKEKAATKYKPLLLWLYAVMPCFNVELVNLLKESESNYLNQATDSQTSISQSLVFALEQLDVASKSTQETISKRASFQVQEKDKTKKTLYKIPSDY